jgi:hypothetical protein
MLQLLVHVFFLCSVSECVSKCVFEFSPQGFVISRCGAYFCLEVVELFIYPVVNLWSPDEQEYSSNMSIGLLYHIGKGVHDFIDFEITHKGVQEGAVSSEDGGGSSLKGYRFLWLSHSVDWSGARWGAGRRWWSSSRGDLLGE